MPVTRSASSKTQETPTPMQRAATTFFSSQHYAIAGASSQPQKFGHKIFAWYLAHNLPSTPLNPSTPSVKVRGQDYPTIASPRDLPNPKQTSLSVITPPQVTKKVLAEAKEVGVRSVWLQPGSFTGEILEEAKKVWPGAAVGGMGGGTVGGEGWCVLVDGEAAMRRAEDEGGREGKL